MKVQDRPTVIYVRDIDDETSKNFAKIKKRFGTNSNNEVVKKLINTHEKNAETIHRSKARILEQQQEIERLTEIITSFQFAQKSLLNFKV